MSQLSKRLETIASLVPNGARVCDVGTDHARLPIFLKQNGIASHVIATDLNEKPLENAQKNVELSGVSDISLRLCDGLYGVKSKEVDTVIIAGMGGEVIKGILNRCEWIKTPLVNLILQPTTSAELLREYLCKEGFKILTEIPLSENGKLYSIMKVTFDGKPFDYSPSYFFMGEIPRTEDGILYLKKQQKRIIQCIEAYKNLAQKEQELAIYTAINNDIQKFFTEN